MSLNIYIYTFFFRVLAHNFRMDRKRVCRKKGMLKQEYESGDGTLTERSFSCLQRPGNESQTTLRCSRGRNRGREFRDERSEKMGSSVRKTPTGCRDRRAACVDICPNLLRNG